MDREELNPYKSFQERPIVAEVVNPKPMMSAWEIVWRVLVVGLTILVICGAVGTCLREATF